jgi:cyclin B
MPEPMYLTVEFIVQYISMQSVLRTELQLVGVSPLLIACKYEEIWTPRGTRLKNLSC